MEITIVVVGVVLLLIAIGSFVISYLQLNERGYLFNNAYIHATKEERMKLNKKPHYRQSGVVFLFIGILFLLYSLGILLECVWLYYIAVGVALILIVYAVVSSVRIENNK